MSRDEVHEMLMAQEPEYKLALFLACWKKGITIPEFEEGLCSLINKTQKALTDIFEDIKKSLQMS